MVQVKRWMVAVGPFLVLALVVGALYGRTLGYDFVWDDVTLIRDNPALDRGDLSSIFSDFWGGAGRGDTGGYFRPLTTLTFHTDTLLYGKKAGGFHATNVLLYLGICWMVLLLFHRLLNSAGAAFAGAIVFAVHPVHVEPVAFISSRTDLLAAFFVLAALLVGLRRAAGREWARQVAIALLFLLALLAKESAAVLVLIPFLGPREWRRRFLPPLLAGLGISLLLRAVALPSFLPAGIPQEAPLGQRLLTIPWLILYYLGTVFFPVNPSTFPGVTWTTSVLQARFLLPVTILLGLAALLWAIRRWAPTVVFGFLWGAVFLLPVLNIVQIRMRAAERFVFLSSIGLILAATALGQLLLAGRKARWPAVAVAVGVPCLLLLVTVPQIPVWKDAPALWEATAAREPGNPSVLNNLANVRFREGRYADAERLYVATLSIVPDYPEALASLGLLLLRRGERAEALRLVERAVQLNPQLTPAVELRNRILQGR
jgi:hypothetical protein